MEDESSPVLLCPVRLVGRPFACIKDGISIAFTRTPPSNITRNSPYQGLSSRLICSGGANCRVTASGVNRT